MKKFSSFGAIMLFTMILSGCSSNVSQEEYNVLQQEHDKLQQAYEIQQDKLDHLQIEYNDYKKKMEPYEKLEAAELEARQIEADRVKAEQKAAAEKAAAEKAAAEKAAAERAAAEKAAEEARGYETGITYENIARNPNDYIGQKVKFTGTVIQVIENNNRVAIRLAIDSDYDQVVYGEYEASIVSSRILTDDIVTIYGVSAGTISYQSTMGGQITVPGIVIERIDQ